MQKFLKVYLKSYKDILSGIKYLLKTKLTILFFLGYFAVFAFDIIMNAENRVPDLELIMKTSISMLIFLWLTGIMMFVIRFSINWKEYGKTKK